MNTASFKVAVDDAVVSVIIPVYRPNQLWFQKTLDSLSLQTLKNFEVIIVNDASPSFIVNSSIPFRIINNNRNQGLACSRNIGVMNTISPFVLFLDPDDVLDPMALEKLLLFGVPLIGSKDKHNDDWRLGFVYSGTRHFGDFEQDVFADYDYIRLRKENFLTSTALISRDLYLQAGGMCPRSVIKYYEDYDFWLRLKSLGYHGKLIQEPLFHYRRHQIGQSKTLTLNVSESEWKKELVEHNPVAFGDLSQSFFCAFLNSRSNDSKDFPCYDIAKTENHYSFFGLKPGKKPLIYKNWCDSFKWVRNLPIRDFFSRMQTKDFQGKKNVLYLIPWMVMGGADLYDLNVLKALKSDKSIYHITLVVARHIPVHVWQHKFLAVVDEVFHLQRLTNDSFQMQKTYQIQAKKALSRQNKVMDDT